MAEIEVSKDEVLDALRTVYDPEIPVNVVDLGLIYDVQVKESDVYVADDADLPRLWNGPLYRAASRVGYSGIKRRGRSADRAGLRSTLVS